MNWRQRQAREERYQSCFPDLELPSILTASNDQLGRRRAVAVEALAGRPLSDLADELGVSVAAVRRIVHAECRRADAAGWLRIGGAGAGWPAIREAFRDVVEPASGQA